MGVTADAHPAEKLEQRHPAAGALRVGKPQAGEREMWVSVMHTSWRTRYAADYGAMLFHQPRGYEHKLFLVPYACC